MEVMQQHSDKVLFRERTASNLNLLIEQTQNAAIRSACKQMQSSLGPCQMWATCDNNLRFSLAFISTSINSWMAYADRCDDKILFGVLGCIVDGSLKFLKVIRIGSRVDDEVRRGVEDQKIITFTQVITTPGHDEIVVEPEDDHCRLKQKVSSALKCDPCRVRL